ncbi:IS3 family transposase [Trueperella pyogenes]|uniref:IS3 family transposase n=2 Tax=Trueperella pyogenes TaxID=1661 RepID=A0ABV3NE99_9ACTO
MAKRYSLEFKDRAVRMVADRLGDDPSVTQWQAIEKIALRLGVANESLRRWYDQHLIDSGKKGGITREEHEEIKRLKREVAQLRRANEILKLASAFFASGTRPPREQMIAFIDEYHDRFSVECICRVLGEHTIGGFITSRGYRLAKSRPASARSIRDRMLIEELKKIHAHNYGVYGGRKMWHAARRAGWDIGRDQVAWLMRNAGISGVRRGRVPVTTRPAPAPDTRPDLVGRQFKASRPNELWVADITYVRTLSGFVYTAFVTDVFSHKIVGWATRSTMTTEALPLEALEQAIMGAKEGLDGLVHHADHGSQYTSIAYSDKLANYAIKSSTGSVGDSYDNALAESVNGLYKSELIYSQSWASLTEVEWATLNWVHWWNTERLHESLDYTTPQEIIDKYNQTRSAKLTPV